MLITLCDEEVKYNFRVYNPEECVVVKTVEFFKNIFKKINIDIKLSKLISSR